VIVLSVPGNSHNGSNMVRGLRDIAAADLIASALVIVIRWNAAIESDHL
jgi:hypothetical protein